MQAVGTVLVFITAAYGQWARRPEGKWLAAQKINRERVPIRASPLTSLSSHLLQKHTEFWNRLSILQRCFVGIENRDVPYRIFRRLSRSGVGSPDPVMSLILDML